MAVQLLPRRAGAIAFHAEKGAFGADVALPALAQARLHGDANRSRPQRVLLIGPGLLGEQVQARHGNHARPDAAPAQNLLRLQRDGDLGAACQQGDLRRAAAAGEFVAAAQTGVFLRAVLPHRREFLAAQHQHRGAAPLSQGHLPAFRRLDGVRRAQHQQAGNGAQGGEMLHRLVRRPVLAHADGIMARHQDRAHPHQGRQPQRRAAIVRKHQKGAAVCDQSAVQRHAVHGGDHGVFAHAVVDEPAGEILRRDGRHGLGAGGGGAGEVGGAAGQLRHFPCDLLERLQGGGAGCQGLAVLAQALLVVGQGSG